jgi:hypothetical protein
MPTLTNGFEINGVVDTSASVLQNMQTIASAAGSWVTYDINQGAWCVVINKEGTSIKSFNDDNIIGSISMSSTGLTEVYNSVEVEFPHKDLTDQIDYIRLTVEDTERYPNEPDNNLSIKFDCLNDPVQAQLLGSRELKQSRVDKIVEFRTDYSCIGLKAGDLIDLTSEMFGYTSKVFRIIKIIEDDGADGIFSLSITALEYDADVYNTDGLIREERTKANGITSKYLNTSISEADQNAALTQPLSIIKAFKIDALTRAGSQTTSFGQSSVLPYTGSYKVTYNINWGGSGGGIISGVYKTSTIVLVRGTSFSGGTSIVDIGKQAYTGDGHVQLFEDHYIQGFFTGTAGEQIHYGIQTVTDYVAGANFYSLNPANGNVVLQTVPSDSTASIWVSVELYLLQRTF